MQKINVKNILIIMLLLVEVIATYFMYKSGTNKEVVLDNVELKELTDNNSFAIYLDGNEYNRSSTWPASAAFQKAECQNEKGDIVNGILTFNEDENKAYINNTTQTTYCYLYFKSCNGPVGTVLAGKDKVSSCEVGEMYRYQGTNDVNNYICFGTTNQSTCTSNADKYMYRIIGVTPDNQLKLILDDDIKVSGSYYSFFYGQEDSCPDGCQWNNSVLYKSLNGISLNGVGGFIKNSYYDYLSNSNWLNLIDNTHIWKYGDIPDETQAKSYNGYEVYAIENSFSTTIGAPIGAPYIHDYLFAYPGGNPGSSTNANNSWMKSNGYYPYWTMTGQVLKNNYKYGYIITAGGIFAEFNDPDLHARPVFYLTPGVTFKTGTTGEKSNPYIIDGIKEETYTATFHFGSKKNDTVTSKNVSWTATWTLPNATQYSFSNTNSCSNCYWVSLPSSATSSYSGSMTLGVGNTTYYFFIRNADGQMASDSDTVTVTDTAPTCSFNVTNSGVTLEHSNAASWYMSTSQTSSPSYGTGTATSALGEHTYYGYVKNSNGTTGTCQLEMYRATPHGCTESSSSTSGGGYTCQVTTYFCDGRATTSERPYSCNGPQGCNGCTGNVNCANAGVEGYSCCNATYSAGTTTYYCSNGSSCTTSGCCSSMFCGSDNCRSGYTAIEYDNYTRYCYK